MTHAEKLNEIAKISIVNIDKSMYQPNINEATKEIEKLKWRKVELEKLYEAAMWLHKNGYILGIGGYCETIKLCPNKLAYVTKGYNSDPYVEKLPVMVTDGGAVFTKQLETWEKMTEPERILAVLSIRLNEQKKEIKKAKDWLTWLNAECE